MRALQDQKTTGAGSRFRAVSVAGVSLTRVQTMARAKLKRLVYHGLVREDDQYQAMVSSIAKVSSWHTMLPKLTSFSKTHA